jgi:hypothetical protein
MYYPKHETENIYKNKFSSSYKFNTNEVQEIIQLINVIINQNYF